MNEQRYQPRMSVPEPQGPMGGRGSDPHVAHAIERLVIRVHQLEGAFRNGDDDHELGRIAGMVTEDVNHLVMYLGAPGQLCPECNGSGRKPL